MINYEQALRRILKNTKTLASEYVLIEDSTGVVLRENIYSKIDMPPFTKSAMDGYAVIASNTRGAPVKLKCVGLIQAGQNFTKKLKRGECVKVMTGAAMSKNSDSVVMIENTREKSGCVEVLEEVKRGENVCAKGEDIRRNDMVLRRGRKISSSDIVVFATVGKHSVKAIKKPEVAILNTGGEIVPAGYKLAKFKIYNSNGPMLIALLKSDNIEPSFLGIAKDEFRELRRAIKKGLEKDIFLISGGVSMGDYDLVPAILASLGVKKIFHKVNVKPGKPFFFGIKNKTLVFGIPGNPVSNFLSYLIFIRPALYKMMGYSFCEPDFKEGLIDRDFHSKTERKHFVLVKIVKKDHVYFLAPVSGHGSADIIALSKADGFMVVDGKSPSIKKHAKLKFITWKTI